MYATNYAEAVDATWTVTAGLGVKSGGVFAGLAMIPNKSVVTRYGLASVPVVSSGTMRETDVADATLPASNPGVAGIITSLAELPKEAILDEAAMAKTFDVVPRTIKRMVARYELPPPIMLASKRYWTAGKVLDWIKNNIERAEKEARRQVRRFEVM